MLFLLDSGELGEVTDVDKNWKWKCNSPHKKSISRAFLNVLAY